MNDDRLAEGATATEAAVIRVFREEAGRLTAALVRIMGDFDEAEDLVQESLIEALRHWPADGIPERPGAWLMVTARRKAVDRWRRDTRRSGLLEALAREPVPDPPREADDRLRLIFTCCHPALPREAQVALTLRAVLGLTTPEIARAFLVPEATVAQRIVRAKRKIVEAGIPFRMPEPQELAERLDEVLAVLYLTFNEGYLATAGPTGSRRDLAEDAEWLTSLLVRLLPAEPEPLGLLALMRLHRARDRARFDDHGRMVLLSDQDRGLWDRETVTEGIVLLERAARRGRPGPYQVQAAIAACHDEAPCWQDTDWPQILALYDRLAAFWPTPVVRLNRAVALRHVAGPEAALREVEPLAVSLDRYHLYHAVRADLYRATGRGEEARAADRAALALAENLVERELLEDRLRA